MTVGQRQQQPLYEPQYVVAADSLAQIRQQMQQMEDIIASVQRDVHSRNQQSEGQGVMPSLSIGHQSLCEQFEQRTDVSRHHGNDVGNSQSVDRLAANKGGPLRERRTLVSFRPLSQLPRPEGNNSDLSSNASASEVSESDLTDRRSRRHGQSQQHRQTRSKQNWMKPEKFNGHGSFETFLIQFENCASYNRWSDRDKLAHLRWSLTGNAAQLLWSSEHCKYNELLQLLRSRFSGRGMEEKFQSELRCRRRNKGESIRELAQDIRRLMTCISWRKVYIVRAHCSRCFSQCFG